MIIIITINNRPEDTRFVSEVTGLRYGIGILQPRKRVVDKGDGPSGTGGKTSNRVERPLGDEWELQGPVYRGEETTKKGRTSVFLTKRGDPRVSGHYGDPRPYVVDDNNPPNRG